jgi:hypothetical protein
MKGLSENTRTEILGLLNSGTSAGAILGAVADVLGTQAQEIVGLGLADVGAHGDRPLRDLVPDDEKAGSTPFERHAREALRHAGISMEQALALGAAATDEERRAVMAKIRGAA